MRAEQLGVRNTEAGFDAISLGLVADGDTAARLSFNTNGHDGDGLAAQFGAKLLFDRGEIRVEIDKQPIDRRIDHFLPHQPCILFRCQQEIDIATSSHDGVFDGLL